MKKLSLLIPLLALCFTNCSANHDTNVEYVKLLQDSSFTVAENTEPIQQRIYQSFVNSIVTKSASPLETIE